jgi:hypothetical protein
MRWDVPYLADFRGRFPEWARKRLVAGEPVYCLPDDLIAHLAEPAKLVSKTRLRSLLGPDQVAAERAFTRLCRSVGGNVVGFWADRPVRYDLFVAPSPAPTRDEFDRCGWGRTHDPEFAKVCESLRVPVPSRELTYEECLRGHRECEARAADYRQEMLGWVGRLMFDKQSTFRTGLDAVRSEDARLGGVLQWPFRPASLSGPVPTDVPAADDEHGAFLERAVRLVWDHQLRGLATWNLPEPQGPLEGVPVGAAARFLDPDHRVLILPAYSNRPNDAYLRKLLRRLQQANARGGGLAGKFPASGIAGRTGKPSEYARAFRMWILEKAVRSRVSGPAPTGLVAALIAYFAHDTELDLERVKATRKLYSPCLSPAG